MILVINYIMPQQNKVALRIKEDYAKTMGVILLDMHSLFLFGFTLLVQNEINS